jgi:EAL domain-containing protein (putative c-di-GMP-specific phosphodiesterase class I)
MAPGPFLGVVVDRKLRPAFGAGKPSALRMLHPHVDTAPVDGQLDPAHLPWSDESQQVAVELGVTHRPIVAEDLHVGLANISSGNSPTHKPEAPKGLLGPDQFISLAESCGLIVPLGAQLLEKACQRLTSLVGLTQLPFPISVNLSPRQFQDHNLTSLVASLLDRYELPPNLLVLEITESMAMDDIAGAKEVMKRLRRLGVSLAIDDFGTGHSSLSYLTSFPVGAVKIDRTFVAHVDQNPVDAAIVKAVLEVSAALGTRVVAEGVETRSQLETLKQLGCHYAQGFFLSVPVSAPELESMVAAQEGCTRHRRSTRAS